MEMKDGIRAAALAAPVVYEDGRVVQEFRFAEDFVGFNGHFPQMPTLPAVVQLMMIQVALEEACGQPLSVKRVTSSSFTQVIRPLVRLVLECSPQDVPGAWRVKLSAGEQIAAQARITFEELGADAQQ